MLQRFDQPNIVQYKESFVENGHLCIVMELASSGDLEKRLRRPHSAAHVRCNDGRRCGHA
jgi:serine/threonine protein kinase